MSRFPVVALAASLLFGLTLWAEMGVHVDDPAKLKACNKDPNCDFARLEYKLENRHSRFLGWGVLATALVALGGMVWAAWLEPQGINEAKE